MPLDAEEWERLNNFWDDRCKEYENPDADPKGFFWVWLENRKWALESWASGVGLKSFRDRL